MWCLKIIFFLKKQVYTSFKTIGTLYNSQRDPENILPTYIYCYQIHEQTYRSIHCTPFTSHPPTHLLKEITSTNYHHDSKCEKKKQVTKVCNLQIQGKHTSFKLTNNIIELYSKLKSGSIDGNFHPRLAVTHVIADEVVLSPGKPDLILS